MGVEVFRRCGGAALVAVCLLLLVALFSSWAAERELWERSDRLSIQLTECTKQKAICLEESLTLVEQRDRYIVKINELDKERGELVLKYSDIKQKAVQRETQANRTQVDVNLCKTELQSLKNLQLSKSATLDTLRLEKETLAADLNERKEKVQELEKEVLRLKSVVDGKTAANPPPASKITPVPSPAKQSLQAVLGAPINQPVIENNAKEDVEDINTINDNNFNDFDTDGNK